jgi:hypothetical protein
LLLLLPPAVNTIQCFCCRLLNLCTLPSFAFSGCSGRSAAAASCSLFTPLWAFHTAWLQQQKKGAAAARKWWDGPVRRKIVVAAAKGQPLDVDELVSLQEKGDGGPQAPQPFPASSSSSEWPSGGHDFHPWCSVCRQEHMQQCRSSRSSRGVNGLQPVEQQQHGCGTVPYTDPFMWRRLLWQLLGKLSPESQAFYAQYLAVCPHCPNAE